MPGPSSITSMQKLIALGPGPNLDVAARRRMGDRIPGEVAQDLGDAVGIRFERARGFRPHTRAGRTTGDPAQVIQEIVHCNRATVERSAGVLARQAQHLTDQPFYSLQLTPNDVEAFAFLLVGVTPQQVELSLRDRDRCSQLMGSVSHELSRGRTPAATDRACG